jgi:7,8-dihydro-6-hydroxymethylpterin-pyrophosphokinase
MILFIMVVASLGSNITRRHSILEHVFRTFSLFGSRTGADESQ